jgi:ribosome recycling factor
MLDVVKVEAYGSMLPLNQVASVSAPEPRILLVTPFDKGMAKVIEKAIRESELGLDPAHQGGIIRVPLPSMTEQRRKELVKVLHKLAEDGRIAIRHARTDARDKVKKLDGTSEDEKKSAEKELQKIHDDFIGRLDALLKAKEAEIMEV